MIAKRANETTKALGGKASYLLAIFAVFSGWRASQIELSVDGERRAGLMFDVVVANGRFLGGGLEICPDAEPDDALFDVLTIGDVTKRDLVLSVPKMYRGTHLPHPKAELLRGSSVTVESDTPLPIELDGEQPGTTPVTFEVVPHAFRCGGESGVLRRRHRLRAGAYASGAAGFAESCFCARLRDATSFSSFATRFSSSSTPRTRLESSSTRSLRSLNASSARWPPGRSASRLIASSPLPARRAITSSFFSVVVIGVHRTPSARRAAHHDHRGAATSSSRSSAGSSPAGECRAPSGREAPDDREPGYAINPRDHNARSTGPSSERSRRSYAPSTRSRAAGATSGSAVATVPSTARYGNVERPRHAGAPRLDAPREVHGHETSAGRATVASGIEHARDLC